MRIDERRVGQVTILTLSGRLVFAEGDIVLRERVDELVAQGHTRILADFTNVDYVDSAGVGVLIAKYLSVRRKGGDLKLLRLSARSLHVLEITKLLTVFENFTVEEDALRSFGEPSRPS